MMKRNPVLTPGNYCISKSSTETYPTYYTKTYHNLKDTLFSNCSLHNLMHLGHLLHT